MLAGTALALLLVVGCGGWLMSEAAIAALRASIERFKQEISSILQPQGMRPLLPRAARPESSHALLPDRSVAMAVLLTACDGAASSEINSTAESSHI
ncbi:hypothetical protein AB4156_43675 [Cupriavidus sp. 2MCAB6]|uniref:hypothetical protein n=1 Tax=Cupriavidus sp. 2MCAB6 TaxID=3232981 RepID=UPI003F900B40